MNILRLKYIGITVIVFLLSVTESTQAALEQHVEDLLMKKQSVETLLELVQRFQDPSQIVEVVRFYEQVLKDEPDNHDILMKVAYLHYRLGWLYAGSRQERKDNYFKFLDYANRASRIKPQDYHTSLLLAGAKAKTVGYLSSGDQVRGARELLRDLQALMAQNSDNQDAIYLLSWLNFEVGRVPALKKILAAILFGGLPKELSVEKGFILLDKLIQRKPNYIVYRYDLGLYYLRTGEKEKARLQFEKVRSMQPRSMEGGIYRNWGHGRLGEMAAAAR